jgi:hypothetical protein
MLAEQRRREAGDLVVLLGLLDDGGSCRLQRR